MLLISLKPRGSAVLMISAASRLQHQQKQGRCNRGLIIIERMSLTKVSSTSRQFATTTHDDESASKFVKSYRLDGVGQGSGVKITTSTGHTLATDVPLEMGGKDSAPQPVETLLAAWMGCTQATALFVGRQIKPSRVLIDRMEFENIQAFRDERGALALPIEEMPEIPSRLQCITGTIRVFLKTSKSGRSSSLSEEQLRLLQEQTEVRCPVANMILASGCRIDVDWKVGET